jgi:starch-binding outer membrane protein, SusD/RagB family
MKILFYTFIIFSMLISCNDDFMQRIPTDAISSESFWHNETELQIYCNSFYTYIVGHASGHTLSPILNGDSQSDNMAPLNYNLIAAGEHVVPETDGGWDWSFIRRCNYFLSRYNQTPIAHTIKEKYAAEIKFFKAWEYFEKVKRFGDVPWLNKDLSTNSPELYAPRDSRIMVMDSVLSTINWAIKKLPTKANALSGRINRDIALALKARICLHEGTFRKYHGMTGSEKFLNEAKDASGILITEGNYSLYNTGKPTTDYRTVFSSLDMKGNKEMILYKVYELNLLGNRTSNLLEGSESAINLSVTKSLVDDYLCADGKPTSLSSVFLGHQSIQDELLYRDPRLTQTVCYPGSDLQSKTKIPAIPGTNLSGGGGIVATGYQIIKYWVNDPAEYLRFQNGILDCPIFRFAETLLIHAEAAAELSQCDQSILDITINKLRARVGMPNMLIAGLVKDPVSLFPTIPVLIDEIRRERRVELALENYRYDDLMRWKAGKLLEKPVLGMKFVQSQYPQVIVNKNIYLDANGFILPYAKSLPNGRTFDEAKHYYFPLPTEELVLNPKLIQNSGW